MTTTITVLPIDIIAGEKCSSSNCPVALAVNRVLAPDYCASIGLPSWNINNPVDGTSWRGEPKLPQIAQAFIAAFDDEKAERPAPVSFELPIPTQYLKGQE